MQLQTDCYVAVGSVDAAGVVAIATVQPFLAPLLQMTSIMSAMQVCSPIAVARGRAELCISGVSYMQTFGAFVGRGGDPNTHSRSVEVRGEACTIAQW